MTSITSEEKLLNFKDLQRRVPLGRTKLYELMNKGELAKPIKIGMRSFWKNSEIEKFISELKNCHTSVR